MSKIFGPTERFISMGTCKSRIVIAFWLSIASVSASGQGTAEFKRAALLMGTRFEFTIVDSIGSQRADAILDLCVEEVQRIEQLLSEWIDSSEVSQLNLQAGIRPHAVSDELYRLTDRCLRISGITQGAFDITFHGLSDLWKFEGQVVPYLPDSALVAAYLRSVGYKKVSLINGHTIFLSEFGVSIGFGAIGK